ncbi:hypothetical protein [Nocardioides sp.]|uniref:divisome protein SepX/GlpR n=1 Tax=Nocardioides sp. TaxID=35761 RepID=UPI00351248A1
MDLSALIFVALAVAWVVYLVPKVLRYHEDDAATRNVDGFSDRLRVLARRDAVSSKESALVAEGRSKQAEPEPVKDDAAVVEESDLVDHAEQIEQPAEPTPAPRADRIDRAVRPSGRPAERPVLTPEERRRRRLRRAAAQRAAARRRRVLAVLVLAVVTVVALASAGVLAWPWTTAPTALVVAWLVLCRVMVRRERAVRVRRRRTTLADTVLADELAEDDAPVAPVVPVAEEQTDLDVALADDPRTDEIPVVSAAAEVDNGWTPVPVPLPTYVAKAPAGRTVRTIDLDSTGVWSSGRNEADSALAREAEAQRAEQQSSSEKDADQQRRASGS